MLEEATVIAEMVQHLHDVLEQPHPVFGGLPICPFVKQARIKNKIDFRVQAFEMGDLDPASPLMLYIHHFAQVRSHDVLFLIHPIKQALSLSQLEQFVECLNKPLQLLQLTAFGGHPEDNFNVQDVLTRQEPYINITVQSIEKLKSASELLAATSYYDHWSSAALKAVGYPR